MELRDYNGTGKWSHDAIIARYRQYGGAADLAPRRHTAGDVHWVFPVMHEVIKGIETGDRACIALGLDFIEEDEHFPFGKILKSNTARALRRARLDDVQILRVRRRITRMLVDGQVPHEFKQYAKLLRHVGFGDCWSEIELRADRDNRYVMRWFNYLLQAQAQRETP